MRVSESSFSKTFGILQNWFTSGKTIDCSVRGFGFGLYLFVYLAKRPLIISSILIIFRQSAKCLNSHFGSYFILQTTCPWSSVTPSRAGPGGRRPPGMWRSPSRPPAVAVHLAGGPLMRHGAGAVVTSSTLAYSNPTFSSHFSAMVQFGPKGSDPKKNLKNCDKS